MGEGVGDRDGERGEREEGGSSEKDRRIQTNEQAKRKKKIAGETRRKRRETATRYAPKYQEEKGTLNYRVQKRNKQQKSASLREGHRRCQKVDCQVHRLTRSSSRNPLGITDWRSITSKCRSGHCLCMVSVRA